MADTHYPIPYVQPHGKAYRYRRIVPPDVRPMLATRQKPDGPKRWVKTWPARVPLAVIEAEAKRLERHHDSLIARARAGEVLTPEMVAEAEREARVWLSEDKAQLHEYLAFIAHESAVGILPPRVAATVNAIEHGGHYTPEKLTITAAYERDRSLYGGDRDEKPIRYAVDSLVAAIGDKDVRSITRADVGEWLRRVTKRGWSAGTVRRRLGALKALVNRAYRDLDHSGRNPFEGHRIKKGSGGEDDRLPFNRAMLDRIDSYLAGSRRLGHETRSIIRMMMCTGAGPAEVGGLALADVDLESAPAVLNEKGEVVKPEKIPHAWIRPNAVRGLKTSQRPRYVPLVGDALTAATDAVRRARVRSKGRTPEEVPLFSSFGVSGRGADSISAKLNKAIRAAGVPESPRLTAYSFRHTMKEALRSAGVADHVQRRIQGHAGQGVADRYGSPSARLAEARDALVAAMGHLGDVDPKIYTSKERL